MVDDLNPDVPDDISGLEAELEFKELEKSIAQFETGYDEPIDNKFLHHFIGGRQMGYAGDELGIIEDTAFLEILDYIDKEDIHYSQVDVYDFIPENKRLSPYLIFQMGMRNEYYTDDFVEYMILITRGTPYDIYDAATDSYNPAPPSHSMAEYALKGARMQGSDATLKELAKIIGGELTEGDLKKLKHSDYFKKIYQRTKARDVRISYMNDLFAGGSFEAWLEEGTRLSFERIGLTPEGDWLPEIKEKMIIQHTDENGNVTYEDYYGNKVSPDDPRISDDTILDNLEKQFKDTPPDDTGRPTAQRVPVDDDIPSVWKTIELVDDNPVVKNPDNFWTESWETLFGEQLTLKEYTKRLVDNNEPFPLMEGVEEFLSVEPFNLKIENGTTTYEDLLDAGLIGLDQMHDFETQYVEDAYSIHNSRNYFDNPINQDFIQNKFIPALESGNLNQLTDVEKARLTKFIYHLQAYEGKGFYYAIDTKADIVKKVFLGGVPIMESGISSEGRKPKFLEDAGVNKEVVDLVVDNQKTINDIAIDVIMKQQKRFLPDSEYMLVFRAGDLGFHGGEKGLSSFSKSYGVALGMLDYQGGKKDPFGLEKGEEIRAYLVPTKQIVDTEALGIRGGLYGNEREVLAFDTDAIPLDSSLNEKGTGNIVERIVEGEELTDNDVLEAIERHEVRKTTTRAGVDLIDQEFSNYSERVRKVAQGYANVFEAADPVFDPITIFSDELGIKTADIFDALPQFDPEALPHYEQFIAETNAQYRALLDEGIVFELVDADPYTPNKQGHSQMMEDLDNGRFKVLATESGFGSGATASANPMLKTSKFVDVNGRPMLDNDVFRAVHDSFGHGMRGNTFGSIGEYNAFLAHSELYSDYAIRAMATETLGQNTWTNYGPHMRDESGRLIPQGDPNYKKPSQRPFSDQKVALFPEEIITEAKSVAKTGENLITPEGFKAYSRVVNNAPEVANQIYNQSKKAVGKLLRGGLRGLQVFDPGDIVIEQGLIRALPRLGLAAISSPLLIAYVAYESTVLLADIGRAASIAFDEQEELLGPAGYSGGAGLYDKEKDYDWKKIGSDTWKEMGAISDTWSLSWRISEPIIDYVFSQEPVQEAVGAGMQTYATMRENR